MDKGVDLSKTVYINTLSDYIRDLMKELDEIDSSLVKHKSFLNSLENRKAEINVEIARVRKRINEIDKSNSLEEMGMKDPLSKHNAKVLGEADKKVDIVSNEISELEKQYMDSNSYSEKMIIKNKIDFKNKQLEMLYSKRIKIAKRQRTMMIAKNKIESLRSRGTNKQQVKVARAEAKAEEINAKIEASVESDNPLDALIENARDIQKKYYIRKAENARNMLEKMDNRSYINGARAIAAAKVKLDKLKEIMKSNEVGNNLTTENTTEPMTPPTVEESQPVVNTQDNKPEETAAEMANVQTDFDIGVAALTGGSIGR